MESDRKKRMHFLKKFVKTGKTPDFASELLLAQMQWKNKVSAGFEKSVRTIFRGFLNDGSAIGFWTFINVYFQIPFCRFGKYINLLFLTITF
jgi:hypothetical protein